MNRRKFFKLLPVGIFATAAYHYGKGIKDNKKNKTTLNVYDGDVEIDGNIYLKGNVYENVPVEKECEVKNSKIQVK